MTGLTARQLQWWDSKRLFSAAVASHRTEAGGYTERRYTPLDVLELQTLADLRARGFSVPRLRHLLESLRAVFGVRLYEAIGEGGPMTLFIGGEELYARTASGQLFNLARPAEPLLMVGEAFVLRPLTATRERKRRTAAGRGPGTGPEGGAGAARASTPAPRATRSEKSSRGRRPAGR